MRYLIAPGPVEVELESKTIPYTLRRMFREHVWSHPYWREDGRQDVAVGAMEKLDREFVGSELVELTDAEHEGVMFCFKTMEQQNRAAGVMPHPALWPALLRLQAPFSRATATAPMKLAESA